MHSREEQKSSANAQNTSDSSVFSLQSEYDYLLQVNLNLCLKVVGNPFKFRLQLNMRIAEVLWYFIVKQRNCSFSRLVTMRITRTTEQYIDVQVIDFCCNRKPIYDFLLVIDCYLSSVLHRFRDIASRSRKPPRPSLSLPIKGFPLNFAVKLTALKVNTLRYLM